RSPRVADMRTLARVAARCGVSLDWLVLGRGAMAWPAPTSRAAQEELFDAVSGELQRRGDDDMRRALLYGLDNAPVALWNIVVREAAELPPLQQVVEDGRRFRDADEQ
ncbi:MAG: hypothetical protein ACREMM_04965, partial [Gemmatimonadales bacterium]